MPRKSRAQNLIGMKFGKLVVTSRAENHLRYVMWNCTCDCGNTYKTYGQHLKAGNIKSCGCSGAKFGKHIETIAEAKEAEFKPFASDTPLAVDASMYD